MGRLIAGLTIIIVVLIIAIVVVYFRMKKSQEMAKEKGWAERGDLTGAQEKLLLDQVEQARTLFALLTEPPQHLHQLDQDEVTILAGSHRDFIESWMRLDNHTRKAIGR